MYHFVYSQDDGRFHRKHRHSASQTKEIIFEDREEAIAYALLMAHFGHYPWLWTIQYCVGYEFDFATKQFENVCY